jgi:hypothetical protein
MSMLCNCCVRELLILTRTWFAFGLPSKTGCDTPLGDFCTDSLLKKTSILRTCCASPAAPLGDLCTDSLLKKTSILRTFCASPAAPLGDFLRGLSHARVASVAPRGDFVLVECRRPSTWSFFDVDFCGGFFACILHGSASLKTSPPRRKRVWARIKLFCGLQGRAGPEESNKKIAEIINVPRMLQVLADWRCEPVRAGGCLRLDYKRSLPLGL